MSEKIADAIRETLEIHGNKLYSEHAKKTIDEVRRLLYGIADRIDRMSPSVPGGEESTEDKPF